MSEIKVGFKEREVEYMREANLRFALNEAIHSQRKAGNGGSAFIAGCREILAALDEGKEIIITKGVNDE